MKTVRQHPLVSVWRSLTREQQHELATDIARALRAGQIERKIEVDIAQAMKFRVETLHRASEDGLAIAIRASLPSIPPDALFNLLVQIHFGVRSDVLSKVYDLLGVEHDGPNAEQIVLSRPLDVEAVQQSFSRERASPDSPKLQLCLQVMQFACTESWRAGVQVALAAMQERQPEVVPVVADLVGQTTSAGETAQVEIPIEEQPQEAEPQPEAEIFVDAEEPELTAALPAPPEFTTLDRLVIQAVVRSLNGIHGGLDELERNDVVLELMHLNEARAQSWFHYGFLDALERRPLAELQKGDNRERRAWYLSGFLHGTYRARQDAGVVEQLRSLDDVDQERLLGSGSAGGALLAEIAVNAYLRSEDPLAALPWVSLYAGGQPGKLVPPVIRWSRRALIDQWPQKVADLIEATLASVETVPEDAAPPDEALRLLRRRLAVAWRRLRRFQEARVIVQELLADSAPGDERSRLLCDDALIALQIGSLEELRIGHPDTRPALKEALTAVRPQLQEAVGCGDGAPVAHYLLGITCFLEGHRTDAELNETSAAFSRALSAMSADDPSFWRSTGIQAQCEFLHAVSELRLLDEARGVPAVRELTAAVDQRKDLPPDLLFEAINNAAGLNIPQVSPLVEHLLGVQPLRVLRELDLGEVAERNDSVRRLAARFALENETGLRAEEKWRVWTKLLGAALEAESGRDLETAQLALDALERTAESERMEQRFLELLANPEKWECAWDDRDALEARVAVLRRLGRWSEAQGELERMAWQAIEHREVDARDWIDLYREAGGAAETAEALIRRLEASRIAVEEMDETLSGLAPGQPVRILFVGGNEVQERYTGSLRQEFLAKNPGSTLDFVIPDWSSNWGRIIDDLKPKLGQYSAMVVMRFVRTQLGRELRRLASRFDLPWISCTGHGKDSLRRAIANAARVARAPERAAIAVK